MKVSRILVATAALAAASSAYAGLAISTAPIAAFAPGYTIASPSGGNPQTPAQTGQFVNGGTSLTQTFVTGAAGFQLDRIVIDSGGKAGTTVKLSIFQNPVGGANSDGFVNTSFSTDLLGAGNGLTGTVFGSGGPQLLTFDFTGSDELTLLPNTKYAFQINSTGDASTSFNWIRSNQDELAAGNLYQGGNEQDFAGTPGTANGRGARYALGTPAQLDGLFAIYAVSVPEPTAVAALGLGGAAIIKRRRRA